MKPVVGRFVLVGLIFAGWIGYLGMGDDAPLDPYLEALIRDLSLEAQRAGRRELISIFIGGGTPSVFSADQIGTLLEAVDERFTLAADLEVTMEANPGTVESGDPAGYRAAGKLREKEYDQSE